MDYLKIIWHYYKDLAHQLAEIESYGLFSPGFLLTGKGENKEEKQALSWIPNLYKSSVGVRELNIWKKFYELNHICILQVKMQRFRNANFSCRTQQKAGGELPSKKNTL